MTFEERFWRKVDREGPIVAGMETRCWTWTGHRYTNGYGCVTLASGENRRRGLAHRVAMQLSGIEPGAMMVCHRCDNPPCCNPAHLFLGTAADNMRDCIVKGRASRGETHAAIQRAHVRRGDEHWSRREPGRVKRGEERSRKLTAADVVEIRALRAEGHKLREIGLRFGICDATVCNIARGKTWLPPAALDEGPATGVLLGRVEPRP